MSTRIFRSSKIKIIKGKHKRVRLSAISVNITSPSGPPDPVAPNPVLVTASVTPTTAGVGAWVVDFMGINTSVSPQIPPPPPAPQPPPGTYTFSFGTLTPGYYLLTVEAYADGSVLSQTLPIQVV